MHGIDRSWQQRRSTAPLRRRRSDRVGRAAPASRRPASLHLQPRLDRARTSSTARTRTTTTAAPRRATTACGTCMHVQKQTRTTEPLPGLHSLSPAGSPPLRSSECFYFIHHAKAKGDSVYTAAMERPAGIRVGAGPAPTADVSPLPSLFGFQNSQQQ